MWIWITFAVFTKIWYSAVKKKTVSNDGEDLLNSKSVSVRLTGDEPSLFNSRLNLFGISSVLICGHF